MVRKLGPQEVDSLVAGYRAGAEVRELAARYWIHRTTVTAVLRRADVTMRQRGLTAGQIMESAQLYREGWSAALIGEHFGVDGTTVWRDLRQQRAAMRKPYERGSASAEG